MPSTHSTPEMTPHTLYIRQGGQVIEAPAADLAVARSYTDFPDKGTVTDGRRLTLLAASRRYRVGEEIRILHVVETVAAGLQTYLMGPKPVYEEYCNGRLVSPALPAGEDPFMPSDVQGRVQSGPTTDFNYEITTYAIKTLGTHTFEWRLGNGRSNTLTITIAD